jgi:hypothetical protein
MLHDGRPQDRPIGPGVPESRLGPLAQRLGLKLGESGMGMLTDPFVRVGEAAGE